MRLGYSCHDSFPSSDTNTQQIFWTVFEVTRAGAAVDLSIPSIRGTDTDGLAAIARHYGVAPSDMPAGFSVKPTGTRDAAGPLAKGWFDWRGPRAFAPTHYDLLWTRDALAAAAFARAGRPFVFETYRPDFASAPSFAPWRRICLRAPSLRGVVTHSRLAADAFVRAGVAADRVLVAHNGYAESLMQPRLDRSAARRTLGLPADASIVMYAGHVGPEKGIDVLVRMIAAVPDATLVILGVDEGSRDAQWVTEEAQKAGAANVLLRPRVRVAEVAPYLYAADCLVIPPTDTPLTQFGRTVLPMKIFTYLAAGRPIVAGNTADVAEVLVDGESALLVPPGDVTGGAAALTRVLGDAALQSRLGDGALAASRDYTWEARAHKLLNFFEGIRHGGRRS
jgi:glycosyltransferase involved in cell wall biosynthesis